MPLDPFESGADSKMLAKTYAKVCSDYLIEQAASVKQMAQDLEKQRSQEDDAAGQEKTGESLRAPVLEMTSLALKNARQSLRDEFWQFEEDSQAWAKFIRCGYRWHYDYGGSRSDVY